MSQPTKFDQPSNENDVDPMKEFEKTKIHDDASDWCRAELDEVKKIVYSIGYNKSKFHFIQGKVEDTLPKFTPPMLADLSLTPPLLVKPKSPKAKSNSPEKSKPKKNKKKIKKLKKLKKKKD